MATYVFQGSSGADYTYSLLPLDNMVHMPRLAGNFILATGNPTNPKPILVECAENIRDALLSLMASQDHWRIATDVYGVTLLYVHLDPSATGLLRLQEKIDLVDAYPFPMNR